MLAPHKASARIKSAMCWLLFLFVALTAPSCEQASQKLTGEALAKRRLETEALAKELLQRADLAFLEREELVIKDQKLLGPALKRVVENVESWIDGDEARLHSFLEVEVRNAVHDLITSPDGINAVNELAAKAYMNPATKIQQESSPGREPTALETHAAKVFGALLSGRPGEARGQSAVKWTEVIADFGLVPVPLEKNPRNKQSTNLLRYRADSANDWLDATRPEFPSLRTVERAAQTLVEQHANATQYVLKMQVLRSTGEPIVWEFWVQRGESDDELLLTGIGTASGYQVDFGAHRFRLSEVEDK